MLSRRTFAGLIGATASVGAAPASSASAPPLDLDAIPQATHEAAMRLAIAAAKANPFYPFGAVIISAADGTVLAQGVNSSKTNPILHGEIVAINNYVVRHGSQGWADSILYTTGEPCPMCMSAIVWAGIGGVVYGSSITTLVEAGIAQIMIGASAVRDAASFSRGRIMGAVLQAETDALFRNRQQG
jgi:tRNA(adenine34) deaminase